MASFVTYTGDGSQTDWPVTFPYLDKTHVQFLANGVVQTVTWVTSSVVRVTPAIASGVAILVQRVTPTAPLVELSNGDNLTADTLILAELQPTFVAEESKDRANQSLVPASDGTWDFGGRRGKNVGTPTAAGDLVPKSYVDNQTQAAIDAGVTATAAVTAATTAATTATNKAADAVVAATNAQAAATSINPANLAHLDQNLADIPDKAAARGNLGLAAMAQKADVALSDIQVSARAILAALPRGYIDGCILSNSAGDAVNDIDVSAGVCRDSTNAFDITVAASTKQLDANWVPGATGGMRDSSAAIVNGSYHIYAVSTAAGVGGLYATTQATPAAALTALQAEPGGAAYVYARILGSILREALAIVGFIQTGDDFVRKVPTQEYAAATSAATQQTQALKVPTGMKMRSRITVEITKNDSHAYFYIFDPALGDQLASSTLFTFGNVGSTTGGSSTTVASGGLVDVMTNVNGQVRFNSNIALNQVNIVTLGWRHSRGRDA
jgi:hypothetical protein